MKQPVTYRSDRKHVIVSSFILIIGSAGLLWYITNFQAILVQTSALESAKLYSQALSEFRTIYTDKIIQKIAQHPDFEATHDYQNKKNTISLPATLSMEPGKKIGTHLSGAETWLYSEYPFPWRRNTGGGLRDKFAIRAWAYLNENPEQPYYEFVDNYKGRQVLRYATADLMRPACINCHNNHPQTPRNTWQEGDVRGVLEIVHPMQNIFEKSKEGRLRLYLLAVGVSLFGAFSLLLLIRSYRQTNKLLTTEVHIHTKDLRKAKETAEIASSDVMQIMNSSPDFIFKSRIDNFRFTEVNKTACDYYGYTQDEFLQMGIFDIEVEPPLKEQVRELYDTTKPGQVLEVFGLNKKKNGEQFPVHVRFLKLDEEHALANVRDITEQKKSQEALLQSITSAEAAAEALKKSNASLLEAKNSAENYQNQLIESNKMASLGAMSSGIAHELNQPLGAILLKTQLMKKLIDKGDFEKITVLNKDVISQTLRAKKIMDSLRIFSREDSDVERKKYEINIIINDVLILFMDEFKLNEIHLELTLTEKSTAVFISPIQIGQVLTNLLSNARDAIEDNHIKNIKLRTERIDERIIISISDNGKGIPRSTIDKIFEPFYTTKPIGKGTGLGLSLSYSMIKNNDGEITVDSTENENTIFKIIFPAMPESNNE